MLIGVVEKKIIFPTVSKLRISYARTHPGVVFDSKKCTKAVIEEFDIRFYDFEKLEDPFIGVPFKEALKDCDEKPQNCLELTTYLSRMIRSVCDTTSS